MQDKDSAPAAKLTFVAPTALSAFSRLSRFVRFLFLPLLLFVAERRVQIQQPFRQLHLDSPLRGVKLLHKLFRERDQHFLLTSGNRQCHRGQLYNQERGLSAAELHFTDAPQMLASVVDPDFATDNLTDVRCTRFQLRAIFARNLHLASGKPFGVANAIHSGELQDHTALVEPVLFQLSFAAASILCQAPQLSPLLKALREIRVQLSQYFATTPLRAQYARDGDELAGYSTISSW